MSRPGQQLSPCLIPVPEEVRGEKVLLRPYREEDAPALWEAIEESRRDLEPWLPWVRSYDRPDVALESVIRHKARWLLREDLTMGIFDPSAGRLLGGTGLHRIDWTTRKFEIGYWLRSSAQGKGYVTDAVRALTRTAFDLLDAARVEIRMDARNERSRRVPERLGFTHEATLRRSMRDGDGHLRDTHVYALIREEYERLPWRGSSAGTLPATS